MKVKSIVNSKFKSAVILNVLILLFTFTTGYSQTKGTITVKRNSASLPAALDKNIFQKRILNRNWTGLDSTNKYDITVLLIQPKKIVFAYFSLLEDGGGCSCNYDLKLANNYFELKLKNCSDSAQATYVYGYLGANTLLNILITNNEIPLNDAILKEKNWLLFEQIK